LDALAHFDQELTDDLNDGLNREWEFDGSLSPSISVSYNWSGSASGFLLNAHRLPSSSLISTRRYRNYGTEEMIYAILAGVYHLHQEFPDAPRLILGDLSKKFGGHFPPHVSHQSGRDADIGYFAKGQKHKTINGLFKVTSKSIDVAHTWAFIEGMLKTGLVEGIFIDYRLQKALYRYAKKHQRLSNDQLKYYFSYPVWKGKVISHLRGHDDHMHIRFKAPRSVLAGRDLLKTYGRRRFKPRPIYRRPRSGQSLVAFAKNYRISWKSLLRWNQLTRTQAHKRLKQKKSFIIGYRTPYQVSNLLKPTSVAHHK
jgi:hypothetical protein